LKSEVPALKGGVLKGGVYAGTVLFSLATAVAYGGERVKDITNSYILELFRTLIPYAMYLKVSFVYIFN